MPGGREDTHVAAGLGAAPGSASPSHLPEHVVVELLLRQQPLQPRLSSPASSAAPTSSARIALNCARQR